MTEQEQRAAVVNEAMEWLGTPYFHGGRIKGVAADCTFIAKVYEKAGIVPRVEIEAYSPQAHLHRTSGIYLKTIKDCGGKETTDPKPGDIVMYWFGRDFSHGGIIVNPGWPTIVHGDMMAKSVILASGDQANLLEAKRRIFLTLW